MKQPLLMMLLTTALFAGGQMATGSDAQTQKGAPTPGTLTAKQVEALVTERAASDGNIIRFIATLQQVNQLTPEQRQNHINAGTIPFRITAEARVFAANGRSASRVNGEIQFYVLDEDANVVVTGTRSTSQMCPT